MKTLSRNLNAVALTILIIGGVTACASSQKVAAGPDANRAAEAKHTPENAQASAHGLVDVQPDAQELKRQQADEAARRIERDRLKAEEAAKAATASALAAEKLAKVYFGFDKYEIKPDYRAPLEHDAAIIKDHSGTKVVVEGYCDERGSESYNLALGERRAMSVKTYLMSLGVPEARLYTISYGSERPVENGHDEKAWAQNRRVQFSQE